MISRKRLVRAIEGSYGNITLISQRLGCSRKTVYERISGDEEILSLLRDEKDKIVDLAENKLVEKLRAGDNSLIAYTLRTLGRNRGYGESIEHSGTINNKITFVENLDE